MAPVGEEKKLILFKIYTPAQDPMAQKLKAMGEGSSPLHPSAENELVEATETAPKPPKLALKPPKIVPTPPKTAPKSFGSIVNVLKAMGEGSSSDSSSSRLVYIIQLLVL